MNKKEKNNAVSAILDAMRYNTVVKVSKEEIIELIRKYALKYWSKEIEADPTFTNWFIAQAQAESNFNPTALSVAGACGVMQIMPLTYREIRLRLRHLKDIWDVESNIEAGIWYDRWIFDYPLQGAFEKISDEVCAVFAGYNCGPTRIKKIIKQHDLKTYQELEPKIPYQETREYVNKIIKFKKAMEATK